MAGFRIGRGRDNRTPQQQPRQQQAPGQNAPHSGGGRAPYGYPPRGPQTHPQYGGTQPGGPQYGGHQWAQTNGAGGHGEPEYFGDGGHQHGYQQGPDPYAADHPGHTRAFTVGEDPYNQGGTYRAGQTTAPPAGPRLHWKELLSGIVLRPSATFLQMRDYTMWGPALVVTFLYGLLALFGFDGAREDAINATLSSAIPYVLFTGIAIVISFFILGVVTHTLARQLGGDGAWQPTVGLSMLITSLTDAPRLVVALFLGGDESFVQVLGWVTWIAAGALLTSMVSKSHDLPWPRALAASAIQLIALLSLIKLGTF
ncbi:YIP1 family protein [Streptomyces sp. PSKA54]|uniref:YIP1 family protein n=1 Tax=Streptomyces himalayensis subsp. aureolus TaxID=2758039 RepID=A0A7W2HEM2_9ACTN|nr:YIP1 family protein [Streptomyces himalayensis]MBA4860985.1 YIP1 family protein [Streptomyces himalayensis subsp. aureolus]